MGSPGGMRGMPGFGGAADPTVAGRTQGGPGAAEVLLGGRLGRGRGLPWATHGSTSCFPTDTGMHGGEEPEKRRGGVWAQEGSVQRGVEDGWRAAPEAPRAPAGGAWGSAHPRGGPAPPSVPALTRPYQGRSLSLLPAPGAASDCSTGLVPGAPRVLGASAPGTPPPLRLQSA